MSPFYDPWSKGPVLGKDQIVVNETTKSLQTTLDIINIIDNLPIFFRVNTSQWEAADLNYEKEKFFGTNIHQMYLKSQQPLVQCQTMRKLYKMIK